MYSSILMFGAGVGLALFLVRSLYPRLLERNQRAKVRCEYPLHNYSSSIQIACPIQSVVFGAARRKVCLIFYKQIADRDLDIARTIHSILKFKWQNPRN